MPVKQTKKVATEAAPNGGRSIRLTDRNISAVATWLGRELISWDGGDKPKLKLKTPKGPRVAVPGDSIIRYGNRRNNGTVTFQVVKAAA